MVGGVWGGGGDVRATKDVVGEYILLAGHLLASIAFPLLSDPVDPYISCR